MLSELIIVGHLPGQKCFSKIQKDYEHILGTKRFHLTVLPNTDLNLEKEKINNFCNLK